MRKLRRFLDFIASRLFFVTLLSALFILVFYLAMNTANIWILVDEGLEARTGAVLMGTGTDGLTNYFREEFLAQDPVLAVGLSDASPYRDYKIRSYRHNVQMLSVWSWPWDTTARADIVESVPYINGSINSDSRAAALAEDDSRLTPPAWETRRYRVTLVRSAGRWKISNLQQMER
ncbi:MAG: hypothetical protein IJ242_16155 [Clostridia bacterium]|nr:hypothetical protein [Clostridia bacterium]